MNRKLRTIALVAAFASMAGCGRQESPAPAAPASAAASAPSRATVAGSKPAPATDPAHDFLKQPLEAVGGGSCNIESVNGTPLTAAPVIVSRAKPVVIGGWAVDAKAKKLPDSVVLAFEAATGGATSYVGVKQDLKRADIVQALGNPAYEMSGFAAQIDMSGLANGSYRMAAVIGAAPAPALCRSGTALVLTD